MGYWLPLYMHVLIWELKYNLRKSSNKLKLNNFASIVRIAFIIVVIGIIIIVMMMMPTTTKSNINRSELSSVKLSQKNYQGQGRI